MAIILVGDWESRCSACGKSTGFDESGHQVQLGYGPENGTPGCGEPWTGIRFTGRVYLNGTAEQQLADSWFPQWMKDLPLS